MKVGFFKRHVGLDVVDTALHLFVTFCVALGANEIAGPVNDGGAVAAVFAVSAVLFGIRRHRAIEQMPAESAGVTTGEAAAYQVQELEARIAELEFGQQRLHELEDRLDFAERLLARRSESSRMEGSQ